MNAISFSLYGSDPRYLVGAVENAKTAGLFYPEWQVHFWTGPEISSALQDELRTLGATIHDVRSFTDDGKFWRFLIHDVGEVQRYIVRDADSRFSFREVDAVTEWIEAGTQLHIMRDHPSHSAAILGGMWGWLKQKDNFVMRSKIEQWILKNKVGRNQPFLKEEVLPLSRSMTVHDSCGGFDGTRNWNSNGPGFVGEYISQTGEFTEPDRRARSEHLAKPS